MGLLDDAIREHLDLKRARGADPTEIERLEREALGPVRRERGIGVPQVEAPEHDERGRTFAEEPTGYHDSTAPRSNHNQPAPPLNLAGAHAQEDGAPIEELDTQQRRRGFLRRGRPAPASEPAGVEHDGPGHLEGEVQFAPVHDDASPAHDGASLYDDPLPMHDEPIHDEPGLHDEPLLHEASLAHDEPAAHAEPPTHDELPVHQPPPLAFEAPPARPRFTPDPPTVIETPHVGDEESGDRPDPIERPDPADLREEAAPHHDEPQPTREFDVLAETAPGAEPEEDVLEETPEFLQDTPEHDRLWFEQRPPRDFDFDG